MIVVPKYDAMSIILVTKKLIFFQIKVMKVKNYLSEIGV